MLSSRRVTAVVASAAAFCLLSADFCHASTGRFTDKTGASHRWAINDGHALIWNGKPYIPVGGMFCSRYITEAATEENWAADKAALDLLKSKGVIDLYINPVRGATIVKPEAWQRILDYLDDNGFRYGVELADGPSKPLIGWVVKPTVYRLPDIRDERTITIDMPGCVGGLWALADPGNGELTRLEALKPVDGQVVITVRAKPEAPRVLIVYPIKQVNSLVDGLQNFWEGYPEYRDRILASMRQVKYGPGMRFWVDPFVNEMGLRGETENLIPASKAWQLEFEAWLRRKYRDSSSLVRAWAVPVQVESYEVAARLIPLWQDRKGLGYVYDSVSGRNYKLTSANSRMWDDIREFRNDSIRGYLNSVSVLLKSQVADVPVVVKWTANHKFLLNDDTKGFDGIGVEAYGPPEVIGPFAGAQCLALVEQSKRPMWLLATEIQNTAEASKDYPGFASRQQFLASMGALKDSGSKGFFVFGLSLQPTDTWKNFELVRTPDQLEWLTEYHDQLDMDTLFADWKPRAVWFSWDEPLGADLKRLERDLWWLPLQSVKAEEIQIAHGVRAFTLNDPSGQAVYIWSTGEPKTLSIPLPGGVTPQVHFTGIEPREAKVDKKALTLPLTSEPAIIRGLQPTAFVTREGLLTKVEYLQKLVKRAEDQNILAGEAKVGLENATVMIRQDRLQLAAVTLSHAISILEPFVAAFDWEEAEDSAEQNFQRIGYHPEASRTRYLSIDTSDTPPLAPYSVSYSVFASKEGEYTIWFAGSPLDASASPLSFSIDGGEWRQPASITTSGSAFGPGFNWTRLGLAQLTMGPHTLRIRLDGPNAAGKFRLDADALLITRESITPSGILRPEVQ